MNIQTHISTHRILFLSIFMLCFVFLFSSVYAQSVTIDSNSVESWYAPLYLNARSAYDISVGDGIIYINTSGDKVGINTTNPQYPLHVQGAGYFVNPLTIGEPQIASDISTKSYADFTIAGGVGSGTSGQTLRNTGSGWFGDSTLYNNGTNIGVGTTNPTAPLHVYSGTSAVLSRFQTGTSASFIKIGSTGSSWQIGATGSGLQFYNDNTSQYRTTITNAGNVGIGTQSPASLLHVVGTGNFSSPVLISTTTATGHAASKGYVDALAVSMWISSSTNIYTVPSGYVGIGTNSPSAKLDVMGTVKMSSFQLGTTATAGNILIANASGVGTWQSIASVGNAYGTSVMKLRSPITLLMNSFVWETNSPGSVTCPTGYTRWNDGNAYWYADLAGNATYEGACYNADATTDLFIWKSYSSPGSVLCPTGYTKWVNTSYSGYGVYSSYAAYNGACYKGSPTQAFTWETYTGHGTPTFITCPTGYTNWNHANAQWYSSSAGYYNYTGACYNTSATNDYFPWKSTSPTNVTCPSGYTKWYASDIVYGPGNVQYYSGVCYKGNPASFVWDAYTGGNMANNTCPTGYTKWYDANALWRTGDSYNAYTAACISNTATNADAFNFETMASSDTVACPTGYTKYKSGQVAYKRGSSVQAWDVTCYRTYDATVCPSCPSGWSETSCQTVLTNGYDVKEKICYKTDAAVTTMQITKKGLSQSVSCPSAAWTPATSASNVAGNTELACYFACSEGLSIPGAPTGLSATPGGLSVSISWSAPTGDVCSQAETYKIYRSTTSGTGFTLLASNVTSTSYLDSGLASTSTMYYKVSAVNGGGEGPQSSEISGTPTNIVNGQIYSGGLVVLNGKGVLYYITSTSTGLGYQDFAFQVPAGVSELDVTVIGGGGANTGGGSGGGAGAGGARSIITVTKSTYNLRVGGGMKTHWWDSVTYGTAGNSSNVSHPGRTWFDDVSGLYATNGGGSSSAPGQGYNGNVHNSRGGSYSPNYSPAITSTGASYSRVTAVDTGLQGDAGGRGQGLTGFSGESASAGIGLGGGGGGQNTAYGTSNPASGGRYGYAGGASSQNGFGPSGGIQSACSGCSGYINGGGGGSFGAGGGDDGSGQDGIGSGGGGAGGAVLIRWDTVQSTFVTGRPGFP